MEQTDLTPTSILSLLESNKDQRQAFISNLMNELDNGNVDPLKVHMQLKSIEKIIDELTNTDEKKNKDGYSIAKRYKALVLAEAEKYGKKEFEYQNAKVKIQEVGTKYNYEKCGDAELMDWQSEMDELKAKIDKRQKLLQHVPEKGMVLTSEQSGETYIVYPPGKSSTTGIVMSLR